MMIGEKFAVASIAETLEQSRGPLDIGEQKGQRLRGRSLRDASRGRSGEAGVPINAVQRSCTWILARSQRSGV